MNNTIKVVIARQKPLMQLSLKSLIAQHSQFETIVDALDAKDVMIKLKSEMPDILILDPDLVEDRGKSILKVIKSRFKELKVVLLSGHKINLELKEYLTLGVRGLIYDDCQTSDVLSVLINVYTKGLSFDEEATNMLLHSIILETSTGKENLSSRELQVLSCLRDGKTEKEIADALYISQGTVHFHKKNIYLKTNSHNLGQLLKNTSVPDTILYT